MLPLLTRLRQEPPVDLDPVLVQARVAHAGPVVKCPDVARVVGGVRTGDEDVLVLLRAVHDRERSTGDVRIERTAERTGAPAEVRRAELDRARIDGHAGRASSHGRVDRARTVSDCRSRREYEAGGGKRDAADHCYSEHAALLNPGSPGAGRQPSSSFHRMIRPADRAGGRAN